MKSTPTSPPTSVSGPSAGFERTIVVLVTGTAIEVVQGGRAKAAVDGAAKGDGVARSSQRSERRGFKRVVLWSSYVVEPVALVSSRPPEFRQESSRALARTSRRGSGKEARLSEQPREGLMSFVRPRPRLVPEPVEADDAVVRRGPVRVEAEREERQRSRPAAATTARSRRRPVRGSGPGSPGTPRPGRSPGRADVPSSVVRDVLVEGRGRERRSPPARSRPPAETSYIRRWVVRERASPARGTGRRRFPYEERREPGRALASASTWRLSAPRAARDVDGTRAPREAARM